jgi:hypothetical protein
MRSTILAVFGAVYARARDLGGILGGLGELGELSSEMPDTCRTCFRGMWKDMDEWLRSWTSVLPLLAV